MAGNTWNSTTKMEHRTKTETPLDPLSSPPPIKSWETSPIMTTLQEQYAKKKERHAIMKLIPEQISKLNVRFPIGCPVWADVTSQNIQRSDEDEKKSIPMSNNFNDAQDIVDWSECQKMLTKLRELEAHLAEKYGIINPHQTYAAMTNQSAQNNAQELTTFIEGRVISVWMELSDRGNVYEIELSGPLTRRLLFVPEGKLSFATDCPVSVMTKSNSWTPGRVLFGNQGMQHANSVEPYLYSVQIHQSCGVFQVVHGVGADRVKYHSVNDMTGTSSISRNIGCKQSAEQSVSGSSSSKEMKACDGNNDLEQMKTKGDTADHSVPEKYYQPAIGDKASKPHDAHSDEPTAAKNNLNATKAAHPSKKDQEARQEDVVIKPQPLANQVGRGDTNLSVSSAAGSSTNGDKKRPRSTNSTSESHERQPLQKHAKVDQSSAARHHVFSRVGFPIWLVHENEVKDRLVYQLTKKRKHNDSGKALNVLESIGLETKCILQLKNDDTHYNRLYDRTHIYIGSGGGTDPKIGVRRAKEKVEDFLLEFIEHDGSKGRLFYNIGRSNTFFHLRSEKGGIANWPIMQRNPFSVHREMGWMSIVDLPYDKDPITGRKKYYGEHLLLKLRFRLRDELNCEMKLCGGELKKYPVRFGDPYVWLWGNRSENVERAVELVQDHLI